MDKKAIGEMLAKARVAREISQMDLARQLGYSSPQYVSNWERGICGPPLDKLYALSKTLQLNPEILLEAIMKETEDFLRSELRLKKAAGGAKRRASSPVVSARSKR